MQDFGPVMDIQIKRITIFVDAIAPALAVILAVDTSGLREGERINALRFLDPLCHPDIAAIVGCFPGMAIANMHHHFRCGIF